MRSILDPKFVYVKAVETDLRKTFKRVRKEIARQKAAVEETRTMQRIVAFSKPLKKENTK